MPLNILSPNHQKCQFSGRVQPDGSSSIGISGRCSSGFLLNITDGKISRRKVSRNFFACVVRRSLGRRHRGGVVVWRIRRQAKIILFELIWPSAVTSWYLYFLNKDRKLSFDCQFYSLFFTYVKVCFQLRFQKAFSAFVKACNENSL